MLLIGLIVPSDAPQYQEDGSRHSPFVIAIELAGIPVLGGIFNAIILISVLSVANSCTFGSTRTYQALAANGTSPEHNLLRSSQANEITGMGPKIFAYVDKKGRPLVVTALQLAFGCLAFINLAPNGGVIFNWLLALSGLSAFFIYGSICIAHIRFRMAW